MKGNITKCDQCKQEERKYDNTFGGIYIDWITLSKSSSRSQDKIGAGTHHFCTEKCLIGFVNK